MVEHISRFLIQSGDASPVDALTIRLFQLSLSGSVFALVRPSSRWAENGNIFILLSFCLNSNSMILASIPEFQTRHIFYFLFLCFAITITCYCSVFFYIPLFLFFGSK